MTARCPLTYEPIDAEHRYSQTGLRRLNRRLGSLAPLALSATELLAEAARRAPRMSIQGVQSKLSLVLDLRAQAFVLVDTAGRYILKPPHPVFPSLPENEDVTMRRFDRRDRKPDRVPMEDFAQLTGRSRETKYDSSLERVITAVERYCTFPRVELSRLFRRVLFCFLVGNEDMHLKNYSVVTEGRVVRLAPAYDLLNTTLVLGDAGFHRLRSIRCSTILRARCAVPMSCWRGRSCPMRSGRSTPSWFTTGRSGSLGDMATSLDRDRRIS